LKIILGLACFVMAYFQCCVGAGHQTGAALATAANANPAFSVRAPEFAARWQAGKVVLDGLLPNAELRTRLLARATELYGKDGFIDQRLRVSGADAGATISDLTGWSVWANAQLEIPGKMKQLNANLPDAAGVSLVDKQVTVRGVFPDEPTRSKIMQEITAQLPTEVTLNNMTSILGNTLTDTQLSAQSEFNQAAVEGIEFEVAKAEVASKNREQNEATLAAVAEVLKKYPEVSVVISGHTDSDGQLAANMALSKNRANAVMQALVAKGINQSRLSAAGLGPNLPIAANLTDEGKARNRRIEFKVIGALSGSTSK
jgi:OmpA-OmpF porin, OOP family